MLAVTLGQKISPEAAEVWDRVLLPLTDEQLERAAFDVLRSAKECFPVAPGALYQAALAREREMVGPDGGTAWGMVRAVASGRSVKALPFPVALAAERIGWDQLREMKVDDSYTRSEFLRFYEAGCQTRVHERFEGPTAQSLPDPEERRVPPPDDEYVPISVAALLRGASEVATDA